MIKIENQFCISHGDFTKYGDNLTLSWLNPQILRTNIEVSTAIGLDNRFNTNYEWKEFEYRYANATKFGIENLGCFVYGMRGRWPSDEYKWLPEEDWPLYFNFTRHFVRHFNETLTYYEVWNEPNIGFWQGTDEEFFKTIKHIYYYWFISIRSGLRTMAFP